MLRGPALYTECSSPEHFLTRAGNPAHWIPWLLSQQVSLRLCPWCARIFSCDNDLTTHVKSHMTAKAHPAAHLRTHTPVPDTYPIPFLYVSRLQPDASAFRASLPFRNYFRWADLTRGLIIQAESTRLAAYRFWIQAAHRDVI